MSKSGRVDSSTHLLDAFATYWRDSAANGDDVRHIRRKSQQVFLNRLPSRQVRYLRLAIIAFIVFVLFVAIQLSASLQAVVSSQSSLTLSTLRAWYSAKEDPAFTSSLCPSCENQTCTVGLYATSEDFEHVPLATRDGVRNPKATVAIKKRYLLHHLVLKAIFERTWMNDESTSAIFRNYFSAPDSLLSLSFEGLDLDKPTTYMYTRTGPGGKLHDIKKRVRNIRRQGETIQKFQDLVEHEGYFDGQPKSARQIIYIVIEDDSKIDESVKEYLDSMGQPYLYFAHGPTRWLGVAQWNAAERAVEVLRDTFFSDGPVFNVDDDAKIEPELLRRVWKVKRVISWPVGNLAAWGGWEGAIFKNGVQAEWRLGGLRERIFPIDMNGFAINSSMIGPNRPVSGPWYVSAGDTGAETFFIEKIYSKREELEGICDNTVEEGCWWAWWNWKDNEEMNVKAAKPLHDPTASLE